MTAFSDEKQRMRARPGPSLFVSGRKYFPSRIVLNEIGDVALIRAVLAVFLRLYFQSGE